MPPGLRVSGHSAAWSPGLRAFATGPPAIRQPGLRATAIPGIRRPGLLASGRPRFRPFGSLVSGHSAAWSPGHKILPGRLGAKASWSPGCPGFRQAGASGAPTARVFPGAGRSPGLHGALRPCRLGRKKGSTLVPWLILRFNRPVIRAEEDTGSRSAGRHACGSMGLVSPDAESGVRVGWREGASLFWRPLLQETPAAVRPRGSGASAAAR